MRAQQRSHDNISRVRMNISVIQGFISFFLFKHLFSVVRHLKKRLSYSTTATKNLWLDINELQMRSYAWNIRRKWAKQPYNVLILWLLKDRHFTSESRR